MSVILPTYNRRAYLHQALESVLHQRFGDLEVIVVDDGSTDDTAAGIRALQDERVVYLHQPNAGRSAARNRGLAAARGEFVALLDDDDLYLPKKLVDQVAFLRGRPSVDLVAGGTQIIDAGGQIQRIWRTWEDQPELTLARCVYACPLPTCTVLFRREVLARLDGWFDPTLELAEDTDFFLRMLYAGGKFAWLPTVVSAYRMHAHNSQRDGARYAASYIRLLGKLFGLPNLPDAVRAEKARLYAHHHLIGACHAYATGQVAAAQASLRQAMCGELGPAAGGIATLAAVIAGFAQTPIIADPHAFIDGVYDELPPELGEMRRQRGQAHSAYHMQKVFEAQARAAPIAFDDWLGGVWHDPRWLTNRGVWSILARHLAGREAKAGL